MDYIYIALIIIIILILCIVFVQYLQRIHDYIAGFLVPKTEHLTKSERNIKFIDNARKIYEKTHNGFMLNSMPRSEFNKLVNEVDQRFATMNLYYDLSDLYNARTSEISFREFLNIARNTVNFE